jgi:hypothetical protein
MVIKMSSDNVREARRAILPNVAAVIDFVKQRRRETREKAVNLERNIPIPADTSNKFLRREDANRAKYNPTSADLKVLYPDGVEPTRPLTIDAQVNANFQKDRQVLNDLVPTIVPPDSYFEKGELDLLESTDHPLRYPAKTYIRKFCKSILF